MKTLDFKNEQGFTLVEIIAVLVILGILAAVAIPKYLSVLDETTARSAQAAIAEIKGRLSTAQAKYMMRNGGLAPTSPTLYSYAIDTNQYGGNLANLGDDFSASVTTGTPITIFVTVVKGQTVNVTGNFSAAGDP